MSAIKIKFVKEVDVDLNAYYPNLSGPLRREIDDAIFKLLGGQEVTKKSKKRGANRPEDSAMKFGRKEGKVGSRTYAVIKELGRRFNGQPFTLGEVRKNLKSMQNEFGIKEVSQWVSNLIAHKHLEFIR